jgi:MerR family copper efflux transcriptional regulator
VTWKGVDMYIMTGELAKRAGVKVETLRFYERKRLLPVPRRLAPGNREYPAESIAPIRFIRRAKRIGYTLGEIRGMPSLKIQPRTTPAKVRERAERTDRWPADPRSTAGSPPA